MKNQSAQKSYRPNVAAVILSPKYPKSCEIFLGLRNDIKDAWQFPQGGIDENESPRDALFRELKEEICTDEVEIIAEYPDWISYDFPPTIAKKMYPFDGQIQKYFLVRLKDESKLNLKTKHPEFREYKFVDVNEVCSLVTYFKKNVYKQVLDYFKKEGYL